MFLKSGTERFRILGILPAGAILYYGFYQDSDMQPLNDTFPQNCAEAGGVRPCGCHSDSEAVVRPCSELEMASCCSAGRDACGREGRSTAN